MEELEQITTSLGRVYRGKISKQLYPSVTTIVGTINESHIKQWVEKVGQKEADRVKTKAASHGTRWHDLMESYLTEKIPLVAQKSGEFWIASMLWIRDIRPHISNIIDIEKQYYSTTLRCAGTIDLVADWDGVPSIIDWKTSTHHKEIPDAVSYWCQLAAYACMVKEHKGYWPKQLVLVFNVSDQEIYYLTQPIPNWVKEFIKVRKNYEKCEKYQKLKEHIIKNNL